MLFNEMFQSWVLFAPVTRRINETHTIKKSDALASLQLLLCFQAPPYLPVTSPQVSIAALEVELVFGKFEQPLPLPVANASHRNSANHQCTTTK